MRDIKGLIGKICFMREWKRDQVCPLVARLILGAVFMYASIDKILHPAAFAKAVYNYQLLPGALINLTAIVLPWLELVLGIFLIIGLFREGSVCMVTFLLALFLGAAIFNLARGLDIYCGCFSTSTEGTNNAPKVWYAIRDGFFLLPAFYLLYHTFWRKRQAVRVYDQ